MNNSASKIIAGLFAAAIACATPSCCCQHKAQKTTENPHAFVSDEDNAAMITSLEEIDPGRLYIMNYTTDYKLDELIDSGVESIGQMIDFLSEHIFDAAMNEATIPTISSGCSAYAATEISSGDFLMGRNYDYCHVEDSVEVPVTALLVRTSPASGKKSISMVDSYWLGYRRGFYNDGTTDLSMLMAAPFELLDGVNEDGFAISVLHLGGNATRQNEPGKPCIWASVFMRKLLDSVSTVEEAVALAQNYNLSMKTPARGNLHFYIADATGDFAILEYSYEEGADTDTASPNVMKVFRGNDCDRYVTNFYVDPSLAENPVLGPLSKRGLWRYDTLKVTLSGYNYKLTDKQAMKLLESVSQDSKPGENTSHTQWSAVYNLTRKSLELSLLQEYGTRYNFAVE